MTTKAEFERKREYFRNNRLFLGAYNTEIYSNALRPVKPQTGYFNQKYFIKQTISQLNLQIKKELTYKLPKWDKYTLFYFDQIEELKKILQQYTF